MSTRDYIAFYAAIVCGNVWGAAGNYFGAGVWMAWALVIYASTKLNALKQGGKP